MRKWKTFLSAGLCAVLLLGATACGASDSSINESAVPLVSQSYTNGAAASNKSAARAEYGYAADGFESYAMAEESAMADMMDYELSGSSAAAGNGNANTVTESQSTSEQNTARKLIRNANLSIETKEFDAFLASVEDQVNTLGGYIESMDTYNGSRYNYSQYNNSKRSNLTVRIPQKNLNLFLDAVSEAGNVTSRSESVEDVTLTYVDMESRKKSLQTEMDRLQEFLEKAETLEDIITLEDRMATVRYQLESMESQLRTYDNMVDYSTVYMNIQEVKELTPVIEEEETAWERLVNGFKESVKDVKDGFVEFVIWIGIHIPYIVIFVILVLIVVLVIKGIVRSNRKKKAAKAIDGQQNAQTGKMQDVQTTQSGGQKAKVHDGQNTQSENEQGVQGTQNVKNAQNAPAGESEKK